VNLELLSLYRVPEDISDYKRKFLEILPNPCVPIYRFAPMCLEVEIWCQLITISH
jgi:hypothetical protein